MVVVVVTVVIVGADVGDGVEVVVTGSLQPNQPDVLHVAVVVEVVVDVVVSSKQPHQPGVWQVSVRVRVYVLVDVGTLVVVVSVPLLSKNFQL